MRVEALVLLLLISQLSSYVHAFECYFGPSITNKKSDYVKARCDGLCFKYSAHEGKNSAYVKGCSTIPYLPQMSVIDGCQPVPLNQSGGVDATLCGCNHNLCNSLSRPQPASTLFTVLLILPFITLIVDGYQDP